MTNTSSLKCPASFIPSNTDAIERRYLLTPSMQQERRGNACFINSIEEMGKNNPEKRYTFQ